MTLEEIRKPVLDDLEKVENEFLNLLHSDVSLIEDVIKHISNFKGKRLRPILLLLCSGLQGGITEYSIKAATIVELLHTATLIHDDVVDKSEMRRGGPSVNSIWTNKISILIGDYIFASVLWGLTGLKNLEMINVLSKVAKRMSQGELLQLEQGQNYEMDEEVYFKLISDKTASLLDATCHLGALTSVDPAAAHVKNLKKFGEYLGIAFQIKDDLLDFTGNALILGKPTSKDLIENTITLPLIYGLKNSDNSKHRKISDILQNGITHDDVEYVRNFAIESGGLEYATKKAEYYTNKALACLDMYQNTDYKRSLIELTYFITSREK
ncbi:polyprenyl synthetase family protein [candidate division KSB1 bacterium]|nr:polyprenyl synthetase family protein [candidate division KSB1 bacterium]